MKKIAMFMAVALILGSSSIAKADATDKILLYIPNRIVDFADTFSLTLGVGAVIGAKAQATQYLAIGGKVGPSVQIVKGINRQYGFAKNSGYDVSFLMISAEQVDRVESIGSVKDFYYYSTGVPVPEKVPYDFHIGSKDFWAIGGKIAALIEVEAYINPIEIADAILGLFFIDIKGDDFTADGIKE